MWAIEGRGPTGPVRTETEREGGWETDEGEGEQRRGEVGAMVGRAREEPGTWSEGLAETFMKGPFAGKVPTVVRE